MSDIKGIPQEKLDRLWMHLLKVERLTGGKLQEEVEFTGDCPVLSFIDDENFLDANMSKEGFGIYKNEDSQWWGSLPEETRYLVTKWVMKKIKERSENENIKIDTS